MCSRSTTTRAWQRTCPPTSATRSSSTASCTSIPGRDRAFTARTPPRRADALTLAGSSSRETTTNEQAPAPAVRRRFREEPDRRRPQPGRASGTCGGQPPAPNVDRQRQGSSVLRPLRRSRLLNDARRGPCGRTDQVGGREQAAEKVIVGSATPISAQAGVGSCAPRSGISNTFAPVLVASLAWAACAPQLSTPFFIVLLARKGARGPGRLGLIIHFGVPAAWAVRAEPRLASRRPRP